MFTLKAKDCPFCANETEEGTLPDERERANGGHFSKTPTPCTHSFSETDFYAVEFTLLEKEKALKEEKKRLSRKKRKFFQKCEE